MPIIPFKSRVSLSYNPVMVWYDLWFSFWQSVYNTKVDGVVLHVDFHKRDTPTGLAATTSDL